MNDPSKPFLIASSPSRSSRADSPGVFATGVWFAFVSPAFHASIHRCASVARASALCADGLSYAGPLLVTQWT